MLKTAGSQLGIPLQGEGVLQNTTLHKQNKKLSKEHLEFGLQYK